MAFYICWGGVRWVLGEHAKQQAKLTQIPQPRALQTVLIDCHDSNKNHFTVAFQQTLFHAALVLGLVGHVPTQRHILCNGSNFEE
eukprot:4645097-Amphidinium_carterae.1